MKKTVFFILFLGFFVNLSAVEFTFNLSTINVSVQNYNGQGFLDKKILKKSVFYRSMSCHAVSPVFPNSEFSL